MNSQISKTLILFFSLLITPALSMAAESSANKNATTVKTPAAGDTNVKVSKPGAKGATLTRPVYMTFLAVDIRFPCNVDVPNPPRTIELMLYSLNGRNSTLRSNFGLLGMRTDERRGELVLTYALYQAIPYGEYMLSPEYSSHFNTIEWGQLFDTYDLSQECLRRDRRDSMGRVVSSRCSSRDYIEIQRMEISEETPFIQVGGPAMTSSGSLPPPEPVCPNGNCE